jgi:hypothetical protein
MADDLSKDFTNLCSRKEPEIVVRIDPFELFGVELGSSESELKKAYYNLCLLCHPDRGGKKEDMIQIKQCYDFVLPQIKRYKLDLSEHYDETETSFEKFLKEQKDEPMIPDFRSIHDAVHGGDFNNQFNEKFKKQGLGLDRDYNWGGGGLDIAGYGEQMAESEYSNASVDDLETTLTYSPDVHIDPKPTTETRQGGAICELATGPNMESLREPVRGAPLTLAISEQAWQPRLADYSEAFNRYVSETEAEAAEENRGAIPQKEFDARLATARQQYNTVLYTIT